MKLSVLIPVYNERYLVGELLRRVLAAPLPDNMERELIVVDDGSTDGTRDVLERIAREHPTTIRYLPQAKNGGKGAAMDQIARTQKSPREQSEELAILATPPCGECLLSIQRH